jgi:hypothetical protein
MQNKLITIVQKEHDKICILEKLLNNNTVLETIVSNYIDSIINNDEQLKKQLIIKLTNKIKDESILIKIICLSESIANQTPFKLLLEDNIQSQTYIKYLNQSYILF